FGNLAMAVLSLQASSTRNRPILRFDGVTGPETVSARAVEALQRLVHHPAGPRRRLAGARATAGGRAAGEFVDDALDERLLDVRGVGQVELLDVAVGRFKADGV